MNGQIIPEKKPTRVEFISRNQPQNACSRHTRSPATRNLSDRGKLLYWDEDGIVFVYKRPEGRTFRWPAPVESQARVTVRKAEMALLLDGIGWQNRIAGSALPKHGRVAGGGGGRRPGSRGVKWGSGSGPPTSHRRIGTAHGLLAGMPWRNARKTHHITTGDAAPLDLADNLGIENRLPPLPLAA
jgi:hypothetical protein